MILTQIKLDQMEAEAEIKTDMTFEKFMQMFQQPSAESLAALPMPPPVLKPPEV